MTARWWACEAVEEVLGEACDGVDMGLLCGTDVPAADCCCLDCSQDAACVKGSHTSWYIKKTGGSKM